MNNFSAVVWPNGKAYFFKGDQYIQYDIKKNKADRGYPKPIEGNWPGLEEFLRIGINTIVVWPNNRKAYFFNGDQYIRYDIEKGRADRSYPKPIEGNWPGLEEFSRIGVNGVVIWPVDGKAYFFNGDQYIRYDIKKERADRGYPKPIKGNAPGHEAFSKIGGNVIVIWPLNGKAYFFSNDQYIQYDIAKEKVDRGYPKPIKGNWPGLEPFLT